MLEGMANSSFQAAEELEHILTNFDVAHLDDNMRTLHVIETRGDEQRHSLAAKLLKEFITPIELEDIMSITSGIDDVTDAVEDVLLKIYMYNIESINDDAILFAALMSECCGELLRMFREFENYKRPEKLHNSIVEINRLEEKGDALYISAVRKLYLPGTDVREVAAWTEIYNGMEMVCDTCEHVADMVEYVVLKNT